MIHTCHNLGQMAMMEIDIDEEVLIDLEDLVSCFNLFRLPQSGRECVPFQRT